MEWDEGDCHYVFQNRTSMVIAIHSPTEMQVEYRWHPTLTKNREAAMMLLERKFKLAHGIPVIIAKREDE